MFVCSVVGCGLLLFFFFKQKTAYEMRISDWSSDVCSSDLRGEGQKIGRTLGFQFLKVHGRLRLCSLCNGKGEDFGTAPAPGASAADGVLRCGIGPQKREENCLAAAYAWLVTDSLTKLDRALQDGTAKKKYADRTSHGPRK